MGVEVLGGSRGLIGSFFKRLQQNPGSSWIKQIGMEFPSSQAIETYKWLGQVPAMREWLGGRHAKGFFDNGISIANKKFEATLIALLEDIQRDGTGQTMIRMMELADRANAHWAQLLSALIIAGEAGACYDGQFFFDTDHVEGNNTTNQSNDLSIDISTLPAAVTGSTTDPSAEEMRGVIMKCIAAIYGFKDNENQPMNELANNFLVMTPISLFDVALTAVAAPVLGSGQSNTLSNNNFSINVISNARLTWTEQIVVFRTDGNVKPFILQNEKPITMKAQAEGSPLEFNDDKWAFGVDARRNVGYGYWQHACLATMT